MPTKHQVAVAVAKHEEQLGVHEVPAHSNTSPRIQLYQSATWLNGTGWPWCVAFWLYCTLKAGLKMPYLGAGAYALHDWGKKQGWAVPVSKAVPGDAVIVNEGAGHCAMFLSLKGQVVHTINGNVSDSVRYDDYPVSSIRGCVHVPEAHAVKKAKPKPVEHATSITGTKKKFVKPWANYLAGKRTPIGKIQPLSGAEIDAVFKKKRP